MTTGLKQNSKSQAYAQNELKWRRNPWLSTISRQSNLVIIHFHFHPCRQNWNYPKFSADWSWQQNWDTGSSWDIGLRGSPMIQPIFYGCLVFKITQNIENSRNNTSLLYHFCSPDLILIPLFFSFKADFWTQPMKHKGIIDKLAVLSLSLNAL